MHVHKLSTAVWIYDIDNACIIDANESALALWQCTTPAQLYSKDFSTDMSDAVSSKLKKYQQAFFDDQRFTETWQFSPNGVEMDALCVYSPYPLNDGRMAMLVEATPINKFSQSSEMSSLLIITINSNNKIISSNAAFNKRFGSDLHNLPVLDNNLQLFEDFLVDAFGQKMAEIDLLLQSKQGQFWFHLVAELSSHSEAELLITLSNIHERKEKEQALHEQVNQDSLTGLLSRKGMLNSLREHIANKKAFSLMYIDLDGFKLVNDSLGHTSGDEVLKEVAQRLSSDNFADNVQDILFGRYGGDEFLVLIPAPNDTDTQSNVSVTQIAQRYVTTLSEPYLCEFKNLFALSVSIGIAQYPKNASNSEKLIVCADSAMYKAKEMGKNRYIHYEPEMEISLQRTSELARQLSFAIDKKELSLHYQPIVSSDNFEIIGFEALLRWHNSKFKQVSPQETIDIAESTGLINQIERWVINQAFNDLPKLREALGKPVQLSINISSQHIAEPSFYKDVLAMLHAHHLDIKDIALELTETRLMKDLQGINNPCVELEKQGFHIHIDDFGTGYSSLAYLHTIPAKVIKVDRSFLNQEQTAITTLDFMHKMFKDLSFKSLMEGVETEEQARQLQKIGFEYQQGYFHGRPQPLEYYIKDQDR